MKKESLNIKTYENPIIPMDFSDPDAVRVGDDYYMVASSFTFLPGVPVLHSKDLVSWRRIAYCVQSLPFERYSNPAHGCGTWAPAIRYHKGLFYVFIPLPDEGIFYTTAKDPAGKWSELKCVKKAVGWIDPCPLWDDDGQVYMVHAFANSRCGIKHRLQISRLNPETLEVEEDGPIVFDGLQTQPTAEGPKIHKKDGWYYIFIPAGGVETGWQTVLRSRNIYGPYEEKIVMHQGNTNVNGPHQGAWVDGADGRDWFVHFQDADACGRIVHLQPLCWHNDWPFIGTEQNGDGIGEPVKQWDMPAENCGYKLEVSDDFKEKAGLQWQWQANPQQNWYKIAENGLHLAAVSAGTKEKIAVWNMPNVLSQMLPNANFTAEISLSLASENSEICAGAGVLGHEYSLVELAKDKKAYIIRLVKGVVEELTPTGAAREEVVASIPVQSGRIKIFIHVLNGQTAQYSYQTEDGKKQNIGGLMPVSKGTWTGARLAIYARSNEENVSEGEAVFHHVHIN